MIDVKHRSEQKEWLDADHIPFEDIKLNMQELNTINNILGGHSITIKGIQKLLIYQQHNLIICEIGCGGGDNLMRVAEWCRKKKITSTFIGIDIKQECIDYCKERFKDKNVQWLCSDYRQIQFASKPSILFSSLFCHHFTETELIDMLPWMKENSTIGFFINDLHRNFIAYYSIKWLTKFFSKSYLVKNDAPLSVTRGFTIIEWKAIFKRAKVDCNIEWKWAFRHLITHHHA